MFSVLSSGWMGLYPVCGLCGDLQVDTLINSSLFLRYELSWETHTQTHTHCLYFSAVVCLQELLQSQVIDPEPAPDSKLNLKTGLKPQN